MSELPKFKKKSKCQSSAGKEDGSDGRESNCNPLPEKSSAVHQKQQKIADKQNLIFNILKRVQLESPESKNASHELALVKKMLQEVKTELNLVQSSCQQAEPALDDCIDPILLFSEDRNSLVEKKSTHEALWQAERTIKHLRDSHVQTKKSDQTKSDVVEPWESPSTSHATSIVVGKGNTALHYSTLNIVNIGDNVNQVEGSELHEIIKSVSRTLKSSCNKVSIMKRRKSDMPLSAGVTDEPVAKKPRGGKHSLVQKEEQNRCSMQHSLINSKSLIEKGEDRFSVGRKIRNGLSEDIQHNIRYDLLLMREKFQRISRWSTRNELPSFSIGSGVNRKERPGREDCRLSPMLRQSWMVEKF